jgi:hypothetical protein
MKAGWKLFAGLAVFYFIVGIIYWLVGGEAVGMTAIPLSGALAALVGYYLWFTNRRLGIQPEDKLDGEIEENAGEIGFYSPHSWWPLPVGFFATASGLGLIIGWWLTLIAVGGLIVSIMGFVLEYEKPSKSASH